VHFVNNVDLLFCVHWRKLHVFAQVSDIINGAIGSSVNFLHVQRGSVLDAHAILAFAAWFTVARAGAVHALGKNPSYCGFACAARARKKIRRTNAALIRSIAQGSNGQSLLYNILEQPRPVFPRQNQVARITHTHPVKSQPRAEQP
jgi:hypothetical protein